MRWRRFTRSLTTRIWCRAALVSVMALAGRTGMADLAGGLWRIGRRCGVKAQLKVPCLVAGMIGGADSIDDLGLLAFIDILPTAAWLVAAPTGL
jgi:hypothetical protein